MPTVLEMYLGVALQVRLHGERARTVWPSALVRLLASICRERHESAQASATSADKLTTVNMNFETAWPAEAFATMFASVPRSG